MSESDNKGRCSVAIFIHIPFFLSLLSTYIHPHTHSADLFFSPPKNADEIEAPGHLHMLK